MQPIATGNPALAMCKASLRDSKANVIRVMSNTGMILAFGGATISSVLGHRDDLWPGIAVAVGALMIIAGLGAAIGLARSAWAQSGLFVMLPGNIYTLAAGSVVAAAYLLSMTLIGNDAGLSVKQWGQLGVFLWFFTYYIGGLSILFWPRRNSDAGAAPLATS
jgi:hypothetical protein